MAEKKTTAKKAAPKKSEKTLVEQLAEARNDHRDAVKSLRAGELVNPRVIGGYRKQIARILTKINQEKEGK